MQRSSARRVFSNYRYSPLHTTGPTEMISQGGLFHHSQVCPAYEPDVQDVFRHGAHAVLLLASPLTLRASRLPPLATPRLYALYRWIKPILPCEGGGNDTELAAQLNAFKTSV